MFNYVYILYHVVNHVRQMLFLYLNLFLVAFGNVFVCIAYQQFLVPPALSEMSPCNINSTINLVPSTPSHEYLMD